MKKALIFDPYLDTLGGGERYALTFALGLISNGYQVEFAWPVKSILDKAQSRFGLDFSGLNNSTEAYSLIKQGSLWQKFLFTRKYDLIFWISDGSIPFLFGKKNYVHFQVPFLRLGGTSFVNQIKSLFIDKFIYNSNFTKNILEKSLSKSKGLVLYPPIDTNSFESSQKENIILSVGRFDSPSHPKRQDILIEAFRKLSSSGSSYRLILAGGQIGDSPNLIKLKVQAKGLNIEFVVNPDFNLLKSLYKKSKFFWHAAGFGIDEEKEPEKVEHFGMTTVEAMAAGCIPIVISKGGQKEIINPPAGFLCQDADEMAQQTLYLTSNNISYLDSKKQLTSQINKFSLESFYDQVKKIIS